MCVCVWGGGGFSTLQLGLALWNLLSRQAVYNVRSTPANLLAKLGPKLCTRNPCTLLICSRDRQLRKRAYFGCTPPKIVHPAAVMCAPVQGAPLISDTALVLRSTTDLETRQNGGRDLMRVTHKFTTVTL